LGLKGRHPMVEKEIGSVWMMCQGIGQTFQFSVVRCMNYIKGHFETNAKVH
jgi:hypothetical protein